MSAFVALEVGGLAIEHVDRSMLEDGNSYSAIGMQRRSKLLVPWACSPVDAKALSRLTKQKGALS